MTRPGQARLADVAKLAGVGTSITSRVLNDDPTVSIRPETRERILAAARELDYRPNMLARGLRLARTMTLGLIVNLNYYHEYDEIIVATERAAAAAGYVTVMVDANDFVARGEAYHRLLFERRVDGLLVASSLVTDTVVRDLRAAGLPFVLVNRRLRGTGPSVSTDDAAGVALAVQHLIELGHRRIGYLPGPMYADVVRRRLAGFRQGLRAAGLDARASDVVESSIEEESVVRATTRLLSRVDRPTAFVVWSPTAAIPALAAVRRLGLRVPVDVSVVSYSDTRIAEYLDPPLATVRMPAIEMADTAVQVLLQLVDGGDPGNVIVRTRPELIERGSTAPPPGLVVERYST
ncbi:MAG: LacI family DNA-binding transcriptional regulator [Thermoleophilia bacterium]